MKLKEKLAAEMLLNENPQKYPGYSLPIELIQQPGIAGRAREIELILMGFEKARELIGRELGESMAASLIGEKEV